ncbi:MAG: leucine-rich repeat domain-containing protein, partial [Oscillospiraceae bacterium]|nr:leucine-rich repeat domain-containing protein [Oscillospiraceae bacterium]
EDTLLEEYQSEAGEDLENTLWYKLAPWETVFETPVHAVYVEEGVTNVPEYAFDDSHDLVLAELAASVKTVGECAFWDCENLKNITMPGVTSLGQAAFDECVRLESVELPACLTELDISVFRNCSALKEISLPDGIDEIGAFMFESCSSLESVSIPDSVTRIGRNAFYGCTSLKDFEIPNGVETVGEYAFTLTPLTDGTKELLPETLEETGASASELLSGVGLIIPIDENGLIMYDLYNLLPASRRTLDWRKADCLLLRHVWYQSRSDYVYVGTTTPATGAYNTYTELWLYVPDGDAAHVATSLTYPPETGTPPLRGSVVDGGDMFGQIEYLF